MTQTLSLRAVLCATTLVSPFLAQAATESEVEALKKELLELRQRYEAQQNALMVLEQRVRQVEAQPQAPQPQRLVKSIQPPAQARNDANAVAGTYGASLKDDGAPAPSVENIYQDASGFFGGGTFSLRPASPTATTTPASCSSTASWRWTRSSSATSAWTRSMPTSGPST